MRCGAVRLARDQRGSVEDRQPPGNGLPGERMYRDRSVQPETFGAATGSPTAAASAARLAITATKAASSSALGSPRTTLSTAESLSVFSAFTAPSLPLRSPRRAHGLRRAFPKPQSP